MRVILHIGAEKTGTSSIQHYLYLNRRRLSKRGFHLMQAAGKYDQRALSAYTRAIDEADNYFFDQRITSTEGREKFRTDLERAIDDELTSLPSNIHTVIISSEHFHSTVRSDEAMGRLRNLLSKYFQEFGVICYLREQGAMCTSLYSTALKFGISRTFEDFVKQCNPQNYYFNCSQFLSRWEGAFGQDAMDVAIYDKSYFKNGDLLEDFTSRLDPSLLGQLETYKDQANQSLSPEGQRLLLGVNCAFPRVARGDIDSLRVLCRDKIYGLLKGRGRQLDLSTRKSIYDSFLDSNKAVQEKYFPDRDQLFLETDRVLPDSDEFTNNGRRALEQVLETVSQNGGRFLSPEEVEDAQHLIKEIYLGNAGVPFNWSKVNLFGKGILQAADDGVLHASVAIRNTANEPLVFSKNSKPAYSIGWQILNETGGQLDDLRGTVSVEKIVPAGSFGLVSFSFSLDCDIVQLEQAVTIEFCIVDGDKWVNRKYPLNSVWSKLVFSS